MAGQVLMFTVTGTPTGQPRPRFGRGRVYSVARGSRAALWREAIQRAANGIVAPGGALSVEMVFAIATANKSRHGKPHTQKPDSDNLAKLVLDAMQAVGCLADDKAVAWLKVAKVWRPQGGVTVWVKSCPAAEGEFPGYVDLDGIGSGGMRAWLERGGLEVVA